MSSVYCHTTGYMTNKAREIFAHEGKTYPINHEDDDHIYIESELGSHCFDKSDAIRWFKKV